MVVRTYEKNQIDILGTVHTGIIVTNRFLIRYRIINSIPIYSTSTGNGLICEIYIMVSYILDIGYTDENRPSVILIYVQ